MTNGKHFKAHEYMFAPWTSWKFAYAHMTFMRLIFKS
jgi:hypothetical protein